MSLAPITAKEAHALNVPPPPRPMKRLAIALRRRNRELACELVEELGGSLDVGVNGVALRHCDLAVIAAVALELMRRSS